MIEMKKRLNKKTKDMLDMRDKAERFPFCAGSFDNCPACSIDPHKPPERCWKCPLYTESRYYAPQRKIVVDDFMRSVFSKG